MASLEVLVVAGAVAPVGLDDGVDGTLLSFLIEVGFDIFCSPCCYLVGWISLL